MLFAIIGKLVWTGIVAVISSGAGAVGAYLFIRHNPHTVSKISTAVDDVTKK